MIGLVHGMGEHMGRYGHVGEMFAQTGYVVFGFDQRGHGRTEGKRGHTPSYEALLEGIDWMLTQMRSRYPGVPVFLYGHSMGGNLTLNYVLRKQPELAGAIVSGPWLKLAFAPPSLSLIVGRLVENVFPSYMNDRPISTDRLTSDPDMAAMIRGDRLGHGQITAKYFFSIHRSGLWALNHASELRIPLLLMHGGDDSVTSIEASRKFADHAGPRCMFVEWPGFKHELHNEKDREAVFAFIRRWLEERTSTAI
ncbi:lysophospholipase [Cohnella faecalis]|uniref:Lysophospholipase n=2 Tax=Cohnella faecalis TaxID=2315694 RepID=A0A398CQH9_9BACL|nr:lysophospholipase [Cohnella faecalis]